MVPITGLGIDSIKPHWSQVFVDLLMDACEAPSTRHGSEVTRHRASNSNISSLAADLAAGFKV